MRSSGFSVEGCQLSAAAAGCARAAWPETSAHRRRGSCRALGLRSQRVFLQLQLSFFEGEPLLFLALDPRGRRLCLSLRIRRACARCGRWRPRRCREWRRRPRGLPWRRHRRRPRRRQSRRRCRRWRPRPCLRSLLRLHVRPPLSRRQDLQRIDGSPYSPRSGPSPPRESRNAHAAPSARRRFPRRAHRAKRLPAAPAPLADNDRAQVQIAIHPATQRPHIDEEPARASPSCFFGSAVRPSTTRSTRPYAADSTGLPASAKRSTLCAVVRSPPAAPSRTPHPSQPPQRNRPHGTEDRACLGSCHVVVLAAVAARAGLGAARRPLRRKRYRPTTSPTPPPRRAIAGWARRRSGPGSRGPLDSERPQAVSAASPSTAAAPPA